MEVDEDLQAGRTTHRSDRVVTNVNDPYVLT
jgi:hypothetical protein